MEYTAIAAITDMVWEGQFLHSRAWSWKQDIDKFVLKNENESLTIFKWNFTWQNESVAKQDRLHSSSA